MVLSQDRYEYQVGGSLAIDHATYIPRPADVALYQALCQGEFCYVLHARQMGKSSLRVRTMHRLQGEGYRCVAIDLSKIGSQRITQEQWYAGFVHHLIQGFGLDLKLGDWWRQRALLSPVQHLEEFIATELLTRCPEPLVIFIDEIDSVLSLQFPADDFFALIRACYNNRAEIAAFDRLAFVLLGVATPNGLISDRDRTPFNIGRAIHLGGFQLPEAAVLCQGLLPYVEDLPQAERLLREILEWSGGQPFLTQKLCQWVAHRLGADPHSLPLPLGEEETWLAASLQEDFIPQWENLDEPEHFRTIRDRLLSNEKYAGRLLGTYQQILREGAIPHQDNPDSVPLRLSGLVAIRDRQWMVANPLYQAIFNGEWVDQHLAQLRPYATALRYWQDSEGQDASRLLRGQALQEALTWASNKSLSDLDYQFLNLSQKLDKREVQLTLEAEQQARQILQEANTELSRAHRQAQQWIRVGVGILGLCLLGAGASLWASQRAWHRQRAAEWGAQLARQANEAWPQFQYEQLDAFLTAMVAAQTMVEITPEAQHLTDYPSLEPLLVLQQMLPQLQEKNQLPNDSDRHNDWSVVNSLAFATGGDRLATVSQAGRLQLWDAQRHLIRTLNLSDRPLYSVGVDPRGNRWVVAGEAGKALLLDRQGNLLTALQTQGDPIYQIAFQANGQHIAAVGRGGLQLWDRQGRLLRRWQWGDHPPWSLSFHPHQPRIAVGLANGEVAIVDIQTGQQTRFQAHQSKIYSLRFRRDGQTLITTAPDEPIKFWDRQGHLQKTIPLNQTNINDLILSQDPQGFWALTDKGEAILFNGQGERQWTLHHPEPVYALTLDPRGDQVVTAARDGKVRFWQWPPPPSVTPQPINSVAWAASGRTLAIATASGGVQLRDLRPPFRQTHQFPTQENWLYALAISGDGQTIATAASAARDPVKVWSPGQSGSPTVLPGAIGDVYSIDLSPDGQRILAGGEDKIARLWDRSGRLIAQLKNHDSAVWRVKFSPDGQWLYTATRNGTLYRWNRQGQAMGHFQAHQQPIFDLAFVPNGQDLATASGDRSIRLWKNTPELWQQTSGPPPHREWSGHQKDVYRIAFSPDGRILASASADGTIRLWQTREEAHSFPHRTLGILRGNGDPFFGVAFSPDGDQIRAISNQNQLYQWELGNWRTKIQAGCRWLAAYLQDHRQTQADSVNQLSFCAGSPSSIGPERP